MSEQTNIQSPKIELSQLKGDKVETLPKKVIDIEDVNLIERIKWATTKPNKLVKTVDKNIGEQKKEAKRKEKEWVIL